MSTTTMNDYMRSMEIIEADDLFAGPGGWDIPAEALGIRSHGFEVDLAACQTRSRAGLKTTGPASKEEQNAGVGDVRKYGPRWRTVTKRRKLLIGSPPCQTFSASGSGSGRRDLNIVLNELDELCATGHIAYDRFEDVRTGLVLEPMRWAIEAYNAGQPYDAIVLEQVPAVLPVWEAYAIKLEELGYSVWVGKLHAEQYGVPQTRIRAVLIAKLHGEAKQPEPTHSRYYPRSPEKLDEGVKKWVTMEDGLGWGEPAATITGKSRNNQWVMGDMRSSHGTVRNADQPAPTITASADNGNFQWASERPATTVQGDPRIGGPGHKHMGAGCCRANPDGDLNEAQFEKGGRLTLAEAAALQTFPPSYPFQGTKQKQHEQVGNAVPPRLAYHILKEALR